MKVKLTTSRSGPRISQQAGDVIEVSDAEGERLLARHMAEPVDGTPKIGPRHPAPERATAEPRAEVRGQRPERPAEDPAFAGKPLSYFAGKSDEEILNDPDVRVGKVTLGKIREAQEQDNE